MFVLRFALAILLIPQMAMAQSNRAERRTGQPERRASPSWPMPPMNIPNWLGIYSTCLYRVNMTTPSRNRTVGSLQVEGYLFVPGTHRDQAGIWIVPPGGLPQFTEINFDSAEVVPNTMMNTIFNFLDVEPQKETRYIGREVTLANGETVYLTLLQNNGLIPELPVPYVINAERFPAEGPMDYLRQTPSPPIADDHNRTEIADHLAATLNNLPSRFSTEEPDVMPREGRTQALYECEGNLRTLPDWARPDSLSEAISKAVRQHSLPTEFTPIRYEEAI
ncbi:MAG: hypothetical protein AAF202_03480 [Pseudomonadota bacterium]